MSTIVQAVVTQICGLIYSTTKPNLLSNTARSTVLGAVGQISKGCIVIRDETCNEELTFGSRSGSTVTVTIKNVAAWLRILLGSSVIMISNRDLTKDMTNMTSAFLTTLAGRVRPSNTLAMSSQNVKAHYDTSNAFFAAFLSPDMTYSCPIWPERESTADRPVSLQEAQMCKMNEIIKLAKINSSDHVLEIGTGWGSFAIEAVRVTGCRVTSLTLSIEQKQEAEARIEAAGFSDKITVHLRDYRDLVKDTIVFDKVVSIEMLEHVGKDHLVSYFNVVHRVLKTNGGIAVFQSSTMPESRYHGYNEGTEQIFPGAHLPSTTAIVEAAHKGSSGTLIPEAFVNLGGHYVKCLQQWKSNFEANFESEIIPAIKQKDQGATAFDIEQFRKKYLFYFDYCAAGFRTKTLGNALVTFAREGAIETIEHVV
ncbi:hypothetical protein NQ176_g2356 [Zarea fungicola]|uniref:Uncharacterized protein n=1 Tax=Zarea fungicola TaxID=93591 RepID=A0ACC1NQ19_9HYPO|nr:hypothetical protein NQ176_g2356 [Lecanicillium fungicola]